MLKKHKFVVFYDNKTRNRRHFLYPYTSGTLSNAVVWIYCIRFSFTEYKFQFTEYKFQFAEYRFQFAEWQ